MLDKLDELKNEFCELDDLKYKLDKLDVLED